ncbi:hypothetical protein Dsin_018493 [Dipteronia sinensis]|uniref:Uncharacterized protein n=1 Tax=Dipteronia sinensis TaxID=43782 RepID=A0AAE0E1N0_9ROSI|nr:hypothetical protein Dsin_018493 [Dipteronia sinensis]
MDCSFVFCAHPQLNPPPKKFSQSFCFFQKCFTYPLNMANSRITRFVMEVAPPQFVSVMRHRTAKMLDTISEEEKDVVGASIDSLASSSKRFSSACASASASAAITAADSNKFFIRGVQVHQRSFSIFK